MAEKEGFEPSRRLPDLLPFSRGASSPLEYFSKTVKFMKNILKCNRQDGGGEEIRTLGPLRDH